MSAPLVVNTTDGTVWTRREGSRGGEALYAPEKCKACPQFVMATLTELAEQGIAGSADVLPVPVGSERSPLEQAMDELAGVSLSLWEEEQESARLRLAWKSAQHGRRKARSEVAVLRVERHSTNESVDTASETLRMQRDRIAELEAMKQRLLAELPTEPRQTYGLPNDLAATAAEWGAWEQVAEVLGVQLPYERPDDGCPTAEARELAEWCTGCNTDHNPDECGYRPETGGAL